MEEKLSTEEITLLREAIRVKYDKFKEEFLSLQTELIKFGETVKSLDFFLDSIQGAYKFYGGKTDE